MSEQKVVEATGVLVKRDDGWRCRFEFDDGTVCEQVDPPFATQAEAQRAMDLWCAENATTTMKAQ